MSPAHPKDLPGRSARVSPMPRPHARGLLHHPAASDPPHPGSPCRARRRRARPTCRSRRCPCHPLIPVERPRSYAPAQARGPSPSRSLAPITRLTILEEHRHRPPLSVPRVTYGRGVEGLWVAVRGRDRQSDRRRAPVHRVEGASPCLLQGGARARPYAAGRRQHGLATRPAPRSPLQLLLLRSDGDSPGHRGSWTFARWLSWRQPSPSNVSHRLVSASREPSEPSSSGQGCF
jgi:hypothetical protein